MYSFPRVPLTNTICFLTIFCIFSSYHSSLLSIWEKAPCNNCRRKLAKFWIEFYKRLAESVPILAAPTHLLGEFSSCIYDRSCNRKLVELRLKLILFLERQNQIWFQVGFTNLLYMELLAAGSLPMNQWCQIGPSNLLFITKITRAVSYDVNSIFGPRVYLFWGP